MTEKETPALSPSIAHTLISKSPLHAYTEHRLLGNQRREPSSELDQGKIIHALLLEEGAGIEVFDFRDFKTNLAKEARDDARARGLTPIVRSKYDILETVAGRIGRRIIEAGISLADGVTEHRWEWTEPAEHGDVLCHGHTDFVSADKSLIIDLKTTDGSAHPEDCAAKLVREGGAIQDCAYRRAVEFHNPDLIGRVNMLFLFCETKPPYAVTPVECAGSLRELGAQWWTRAVESFSRGLAKDYWPSYVEGTHRAEAPGWMLARAMTEEAEG